MSQRVMFSWQQKHEIAVQRERCGVRVGVHERAEISTWQERELRLTCPLSRYTIRLTLWNVHTVQECAASTSRHKKKEWNKTFRK